MTRRILMLGPETGWHASQLRDAAKRRGFDFASARYETLACQLQESAPAELTCEQGRLDHFAGILPRTMPAASMERLTFRLSLLHAIADGVVPSETLLVNSPRCLEWCIDKSAATMRLAGAGFPVPATQFVQSRGEAMHAFADLGGDCVLKPVFGGEGRGVMRVQDQELAWYAAGTLDQVDALLQIQEFVPPGGVSLRVLVIGDQCIGMRRSNGTTFRTNVAAGGKVEQVDLGSQLLRDARAIAKSFDLTFGAIDLLERDSGPPVFLEVNAVPGWKGAQKVVSENIADCLMDVLSERMRESR
ncbi:MAG: ATP-grasp domain-containing protein [Planctomycetota bacterium]